MNKVLILYPGLFNSYSKFFRKVERITSRLNAVEIIYPSDFNGLIRKYFEESSNVERIRHTDEWSSSEVTHAIVFDDGEEFPGEIQMLRSAGVPLREIVIALTRVINIKVEAGFQGVKSTPDYEYIGRGSYWGNPYSMYEDGEDRDEVIRKFKYDFDFEKFPNKEKEEVYKLAGKRLGCFCKPEACHGDVLADFLNAWDDGK